MNETQRKTYKAWLIRMAALTAISGGIAFVAGSGEALAATPAVNTHPPERALLLFAIVWLIASLRLRRDAGGRQRLGFDPIPVRRLAADRPRRRRSTGGQS